MSDHPIPGSGRHAEPGARALGPCDPAQRLQVSLIVRRRDNEVFHSRVQEVERGAPANAHLSREAFASQFGAAPDDLAKVSEFAASHGLAVSRVDPAARTVVLAGCVGQFNAAFGITLQHYQHQRGDQVLTHRGHAGDVRVPAALQGIVTAVLGLDDRPQARTHFRFRPPIRPATGLAPVSYTPVELAALYNFPAGDGKGQCIGLIELGGGYEMSDLRAYFAQLGMAVPTVVAIPVDDGRNQPDGNPNGPDGEVTLDIEVAGAIAPRARLAVYFAGNTDAGFLNALNAAVHDTTNRPSVISISWGGPEPAWTRQSMTVFNEALQAAATMGVTVCVASGDSGSGDGVGDGGNHVDFPASSPFALGCGGTRLDGRGATIRSEVVWNDGARGGAGGGGISAVFPVPAWQKGLKAAASGAESGAKSGPGSEAASAAASEAASAATSGASSIPGRGSKAGDRASGDANEGDGIGEATLVRRGVPDVAGDADPESGYSVFVGGTAMVIGGTSAVAPLWAGLIARINGSRAVAAGFINPKLYGQPAALRDITRGNNGAFAAASGWDACTGLGSPNGQKIAGLI